MTEHDLPVAVIGAGQVDLAAAVQLIGDPVAARQVHLALPETGVCSVPAAVATSNCCGGPAIAAGSCCAADKVAKAEGEAGCGCGPATNATPRLEHV